MNLNDGLQLADIISGLAVVGLGFVYKTIQERINKLEEVSRLEDKDLKEFIKDTDNKWRDNIARVHDKVERNGQWLIDHGKELSDRISRLEGKNG